MKKNKQILREGLNTIKQTNICILRISGDKEGKNIQKNNSLKLQKFTEKQESTHPGTSVNSEQDKHRELQTDM